MKTRNRLSAILLAMAMIFVYMPGMAFAFDEPMQNDPAVGSATEPPTEDNIGEDGETVGKVGENAEGQQEQTEAGSVSKDAPNEDAEVIEKAPAGEQAETPSTATEEDQERVEVVEFYHGTTEEMGDPDELLDAYMQKQISVPSKKLRLKAAGNPRYNNLNDNEQRAYTELAEQLTAATSGDGGHHYSEMNISFGISWDEAQRVVDALMADMPYEFFWYDRIGGYTFWSESKYSGGTVTVTSAFAFSVSKRYRSANYAWREVLNFSNGEQRTLNIYEIVNVATPAKAAAYARSIVDSCKAESDVERLTAYKDAICGLVKYNHAAADGVENGITPTDLDPWEMIYVFDRDPNTNVVCEGYSKAFQYLCDYTQNKGAFLGEDIDCYTVTGTTGGPHMWNILRMEDGHYYIADLTNSDSDSETITIGCDPSDPDGSSLFLNGCESGSVNNGYRYLCGDTYITYVYDKDTKSLYSQEELTMSPYDYTDREIYKLRLTLGTPICGTKVEAMSPRPAISVKSDRITTVDAYWEKDGKAFSGTMLGGEKYTANIVASIPKDKQSDYSYKDGITVKVNGVVVTPISRTGSSVTLKVDIVAKHALTAHNAIIPSLSAAGSKAYWSCNACGKYFGDSAGTKEIAKNSWVIPKLIPISKTAVTGVANKVYTGKALTQKPVVKVGGKTLVSGRDYKLSYKSNKKVGTATVTITGTGAYGASVSKKFKINPKGTSLSKLTAAKKGFTAKWNKQATQTTGYQLQYALNKKFTSGKKTVIVTKNGTVSKKVTKLKGKKKYYVRVRTYKTVSGKKYYSAWSAVKTIKTK